VAGRIILAKEVQTLKTYVPKPDEVQRKWYLVDAQGQVLGRLASRIAFILQGKHKPSYARHLDVGDHVVVVNADKVRLTGRKAQRKTYVRFTGYPGGLREVRFRTLLQTKPERIIEHAVRGMLPRNNLGRRMFKKLKVYAGDTHPHQAQQPEALEL